MNTVRIPAALWMRLGLALVFPMLLGFWLLGIPEPASATPFRVGPDDVVITESTTWSSDTVLAGDLIVTNAATLTLVNVQVRARNIIVAPGAALIADGQGHPSRQGPGAGADQNDWGAGGGGHGGVGGMGSTGAAGGGVYDSVSTPTLLGSGGGIRYSESACGGTGGGAVHLIVTQTLQIDGRLSADGTPGAAGDRGCGGGAGGSLWLETTVLSGTGSIQADGGNGSGNSRAAGGGSGGRIALYFNANTFTGTLQALGGSGAQYGGPGTVYLHQNGGSRQLRIDNGGHAGAGAGLLPGSYRFDEIRLTGYGHLTVYSPTSVLTLPGQRIAGDGSAELKAEGLLVVPPDYTVDNVTLAFAGALRAQGAITTRVGGGFRFLAAPGTNDGRYDFKDLTIGTGTAVQAVPYNNGNSNYQDDAGITLYADNLNLETGAIIQGDGLGYGSDLGPGAGQPGINAENQGGGGGHGGWGGTGKAGGMGGDPYDDFTAPYQLGSGGARRGNGGWGGTGGGAVHLVVTDSLILNGIISVNGTDGFAAGYNSGGGGSGGSIWIEAGALSGDGTLRANGGVGGSCIVGSSGGGAGGRIALHADIDTFNGRLQAYGNDGAQWGGSGTIYRESPAGRRIFVDNNNHDSRGAGLPSHAYQLDRIDLQHLGHLTVISPTSVLTLSPGVLAGDGSGRLVVEGRAVVPSDFTVSGVILVVAGELEGTDTLNTAGSGGVELRARTPWHTGSYTFTEVNIGDNTTLRLIPYEDGDTDYTDDYGVELNADRLTLAPAGTISADEVGYGSSRGPGTSSEASGYYVGSGGASYGGYGGGGSGDTTGGPVYGDPYTPVALGSGGGFCAFAAGPGGGAIHLRVRDTLTLSGTLSVNGGTGGVNGFNGTGGGSGGSLWIETRILLGNGTARANGGPATNRGGGGSGGRIAVYVSEIDAFSGAFQAFGNEGAQWGGSGTVYRESPAGHQLFIDNNNRESRGAGILPGAYQFDQIEMRRLGHLTLPAVTSVLTLTPGALTGDGSARLIVEGRTMVPPEFTVGGAMLVIAGELEGGDTLTTAGNGGVELWAHTPWHTGSYTFTEINVGANTALRLISYDDGDTDYTDDYGFELNADRLALAPGGTVSADEAGYGSGRGPGASSEAGGYYIGSGGASYGGYGGTGVGGFAGGSPYGNLYTPFALGSGGGYCGVAFSPGGGAVHLRIRDTLIVSGTLSANGGTGGSSRFNSTGGGSGGSLWIETRRLRGTGTIRANGGPAAPSWGGGGGGGRIAVYVSETDAFSGTFQAFGSGGAQWGGPGTVYQESPAGRRLFIDNDSHDSLGAVLPTDAYQLDRIELQRLGHLNLISSTSAITLGPANALIGDGSGRLVVEGRILAPPHFTVNGAMLVVAGELEGATTLTTTGSGGVELRAHTPWHTGSYTFTEVNVGANTILRLIPYDDGDTDYTEDYGVTLNTERLTIAPAGLISADAVGYGSDRGPGTSPLGDGYYVGSGGAGYGGSGGAGGGGFAGGSPYGSVYAPIDLGSGAGYSGMPAGPGGGAIHLRVEDTLIVSGTLSANGGTGGSSRFNGTGGSSGGSIWIETRNLRGNGTVRANGGAGMAWGGGGAGGRVAVYITETDAFSGTYQIQGGTGNQSGESGTLYLDVVDPLSSAVIAAPAEITADGQATATVTITLRTHGGYLIPGKATALEISSGAGLFIAGRAAAPGERIPLGLSNGQGQVTTVVTTTRSGPRQLTAWAEDVRVVPAVTLTALAGSPDPQHSWVWVDSLTLPADGTTSAEVQVRICDAFGNPVPGVTVALTDTGHHTMITQPDAATDDDGRTAGAIRGSRPETVTLSALLGGAPFGRTTELRLIGADLAVDKVGPDGEEPNRPISYTLTVRNQGLMTAFGVRLTDTLPAHVGWISQTGAYTFTRLPDGVGVWELGDLAPDDEASILAYATISATAAPFSTLINQAEAGSETPDGNADNDRATWSTTVVPPAPELQAGPPYPALVVPAGSTAELAVTVHNTGTAPLFNVVITPPVHIPWLTVAPAAVDELEPGETVTLTLTATPPPGVQPGRYRDLLRVGGDDVSPQWIALTVHVQAPLRDVLLNVHNNGGAPVPGARVRLAETIYVETEGIPSTETFYREALTGPNGVMTATALEAGDFDYQITADGHQPAEGVFAVIAGSDPQVVDVELTADLSLAWTPTEPQLAVQPGEGALVDVEVRNTSLITLTNLVLTPPTTPEWVFLGQGGLLETLPPGAVFTFTLHATPPEDTPPAVYSGTVGLQADGGLNVSIPFAVRVTLSARRTLQVTVIDSDGEPVPDAEIELVGQQSAVVVSGTISNTLHETYFGHADSNGRDIFPNMTVGWYDYRIRLNGFQAAAGSLEVLPGTGTQEETIVVPKTGLDVSWTVEPTPFEDIYTATLRMVFDPYSSHPTPGLGPTSACFSETSSLQIYNVYPVTIENARLEIQFSCSVNYNPDLGEIAPNSMIHVPLTFGGDCCDDHPTCSQDPEIHSGVATLTGNYRHLLRAPLYSAAAPRTPYVQPGTSYDILAKLVNEGYPANGNLYGNAGPIHDIRLSPPRLLNWITVTPTEFTEITPGQEVDFWLQVDVPEWLQVGEYHDAVIISTGDGVTTALQIDAKMEPHGLTIETQFVTPLRPDGSGGTGDPQSGVEGGWDTPPWWNAEVPVEYPEENEPIEMVWPLSRTCCRDCPHDPVHYWGWLGNVWTETKLGPYGFPHPHLSGGLVYLEILQRISLERQAFTARMMVAQKGALPVEDIVADIVVRDEDGVSWVVEPGKAQGGFVVTPTLPTELGDLSPGQSQLAGWVIIPDRLPYDPEEQDSYAGYESGGEALLDQLGAAHPGYATASDNVDQLNGNIAQVRATGDSDALRTERNTLIAALNEIALDALGQTFDNLSTVATYVPDIYTLNENGARQLLARLSPDHPRYTETLQLKEQLDANIAQARASGDTAELSAGREALLGQLDDVAHSALNADMDQLSELSGGLSGPQGKVYRVQAYISYVVNGEHFVIHTQEEPIVVKPEPFVWIDYFIPRYVWGGEPFKLWALATNFGYGEAKKFKIHSAQPRIVRNDSDLPVNFTIISPLEVDFGTLDPEESDKRYWEILPSHDGTFLDFTASCEHADYLGLKLSEQVYCNGNAYIIDNPPTNEAMNWGEDSPCAVSQVQGRRADPVNTYSGNFSYNATDVSIPTWGEPLMLERSYNSRDVEDGPFGAGWTHNYDLELTYRSFLPISSGVPLGPPASLMEFKAPRGSRLYYEVGKDGSFTPYPGVKAALLRNLGTYTVTLSNQITYVFDAKQRLVRQIDANNNAQELTYDGAGNLIRVTDSAGRALSFTYNGAHHITSITDPLGRVTLYAYDSYGTLASVTDPLGRVTTYTYSGAGVRRQLNSITDANENTMVFNQYDTKGRVILQRDAGGNTTTFSYGEGFTTMTDPLGASTTDYYSEDGLLTRERDTYGHSEFYEYDAEFNQIARIDKNGHRTEYDWDDCGCSVSALKAPLGHTTSRAFDGRHRLTGLTDPNGNTTTYQYGPYADPTLVTNPLGESTTYTYGSHGELRTMTDPAGGTTTYEYDPYGNLVRTTDPLGHATATEYDVAGRVLSTTNPRGYTTRFTYDDADNLLVITDPLSGTKSYTYDGVDNRLTETDANGHTIAYAYDPRNLQIRTTDPLSGVTRFEFDAVGRKTEETDANGHTTTYVYDRLGRTTRVIDPVGGVRIYTFDPVGNTLTETDPEGRTTTYAYDPKDRVIAVRDALSNTVTFAYDANNNTLRSTDAAGRVQWTEYDGLDRPVRIITNYRDGRFDPAHPDEDSIVTKHYDPAGNLDTVTDALGRTLRTEYDLANRPRRAIVNYVDGIFDPERPDEDLITRNAYDAAGNVLTTTNPAGRITAYAYDPLNRLIAERNPLGGETLSEYDAAGNRIAVTDPGGATTRYRYDANNRLVVTTDPLSGTLRREYDAAGNLTAETDANAHTRRFIYDAADRLIEKRDALGHSTCYEYDAAGNRTAVTDPMGATTRFTYNALDRVTAVADPLSHTTTTLYDVLGNPIVQCDAAGRVTTYAYDGLNRLITTTNAAGGTIVNAYDAGGNKTAVTDPAGRTTRFFYDRCDRLIRTVDALGGTAAITYDVMGNALSRVDAAGAVTRFAYDELNRNITTTNALSGTGSATYDAVGNRLTETDANGITTAYTYDALARLVDTIDPLSGTTHNDYDPAGNRTAVTDPLGRTTRFFYDAENRLERTVDALGGETRTTYDAAGNPVAVTDPNGHTTTIRYDAAGRRIAVIDPLGRSRTNTYDAVGNPLTETDGNGGTATFAYDSLNRLILSTDALGAPTRFIYDAVDNRIATIDAAGYTATVAYDALNRAITTTDPLSGTVIDAYDAVGNRIATTDPNGHRTTFEYDALGHLITTTDALGGRAVTYYDAVGTPLMSVDAAGNITRFAYDRLYRLIATTNPLGDVAYRDYDAAGNLIAATDEAGATTVFGYDALNRLVTTTDALDGVESTAYDAAGNVISVTDAEGRTTTYTYDAADQRIAEQDAAGELTTYAYDDAGNLIATTDAEGHTTSMTYDALNQPLTVVDALGFSTAYAYDRLGNRTLVTDANGTATRSAYDPLGRLVTITDALGGVQTFAYDAADNPVTVTDAAGRITRTAYDALNRPVTITDPLSGTLVHIYDAVGNRIATIDANGTKTRLVYDALGRLIRTVDPLSGTTHTVYDAVGNRTAVTDPNGNSTRFNYDALGRLIEAIDPLFGVTRYSYDAVGNPIAAVDAAGRSTAFAYDELDRPVTITNPLSGTTVYAYDAVGNRTAVTDAAGRTTHTAYDALYRPVAVTDALGQIAQYGYDAAGNRIWEQDRAGRITRIAYDALNRMVAVTDALGGVTEFTYDAVGNRITATDAEGHTTTFTYDALDRPTLTTNPLFGTTRVAYDPVGNPVATTDAGGRITTAAYDALNRPVTVTDALSGITLYRYDAAGNRIAVIDAEGRKTGLEYDALNRLTTVVDPLSGITTYAYDAVGNRIAVTDPAGHFSQMAYDALDRLTLFSDALGQTTAYTYDAVGNPVIITDPASAATRIDYDALDRPLAVTDPLSRVTAYAYDAAGNRTVITDTAGAATRFIYDDLNRRIREIDPLGHPTEYGYDRIGNRTAITDALHIVSRYEYDALSRLTAVVENFRPDLPSDAETNVRTAYAYDAVGNRIAVTNANGAVASSDYDALNRLISTSDPLGDRYIYGYDAVGNLIQRTDANGNTSTYVYDGLNRVVQINYPDGAVALAYDAVGNRTVMTDTVGVTRYEYDPVYRLVSVTDPYTQAVRYEYDTAGNRTAVMYPDGKGVAYAFDAAGQLAVVDDWDGGATTYTYDAAGRPLRVAEPNGTETAYTYDAAGRLTGLAHTRGGTALLSRYEYTLDALGNRVAVTETLSRRLSADFNAAPLSGSAPLTVAFTAPAADSAVEFHWDFGDGATSAAANPVHRYQQAGTFTVTLALTASDGASATLARAAYIQIQPAASHQQYLPLILGNAGSSAAAAPVDPAPVPAADPGSGLAFLLADPMLLFLAPLAFLTMGGRGRRSRKWAWPLSALLLIIAGIGLGLAFTAAPAPVIAAPAPLAAPSLIRTALPVAESIPTSRTIHYTYDPLDRLVEANYSTGESFAYTYDAVGNRLTADTPVGSEFYLYDAADRIVSRNGVAYSWDANGNLLDDGVRQYTYDAANRLTDVLSGTTHAHYTYSGDGVRLAQTVNGFTTRYVVDQWTALPQVLQEQQGSRVQSYLYGDGLLAVQDSGTWAYYHSDGLGSLRQATDSAGQIQLARSYAPFGQLLEQEGALPGSFGFAGEQYDPAAGLQFLRARYYDPGMGRFISRDPFPAYATIPATLHRYAYAGNNPINATDPSGLFGTGFLSRLTGMEAVRGTGGSSYQGPDSEGRWMGRRIVSESSSSNRFPRWSAGRIDRARRSVESRINRARGMVDAGRRWAQSALAGGSAWAHRSLQQGVGDIRSSLSAGTGLIPGSFKTGGAPPHVPLPSAPSYSVPGFAGSAFPSAGLPHPGTSRQERIAERRARHIREINEDFQALSRGKLPAECESTGGGGFMDHFSLEPLADFFDDFGDNLQEIVQDGTDKLGDWGDTIGLGDEIRAAGKALDIGLEASGAYDKLDEIGDDLAGKVRDADEWITRNADTIALAVSLVAVGGAIVLSGGAVLPAMAMGGLVGAVSGVVEYAVQCRMAGGQPSIMGLASAALGGAVGGAVQGAFGPGFGTLIGGFASGVLSTFATNVFQNAVSRAQGGPGVSLTGGLMNAGMSGLSNAGANMLVGKAMPSCIPHSLSEALGEGVVSGAGRVLDNYENHRDLTDGLAEAVVPSVVSGLVESGMEGALETEVDSGDDSYTPRAEGISEAASDIRVDTPALSIDGSSNRMPAPTQVLRSDSPSFRSMGGDSTANDLSASPSTASVSTSSSAPAPSSAATTPAAVRPATNAANRIRTTLSTAGNRLAEGTAAAGFVTFKAAQYGLSASRSAVHRVEAGISNRIKKTTAEVAGRALAWHKDPNTRLGRALVNTMTWATKHGDPSSKILSLGRYKSDASGNPGYVDWAQSDPRRPVYIEVGGVFGKLEGASIPSPTHDPTLTPKENSYTNNLWWAVNRRALDQFVDQGYQFHMQSNSPDRDTYFYLEYQHISNHPKLRPEVRTEKGRKEIYFRPRTSRWLPMPERRCPAGSLTGAGRCVPLPVGGWVGA